MVQIIGYIVLGIYVFALAYITFYCLMQFHLLYHYKKHHRKQSQRLPNKPTLNGNLPFVTIQLPIFNERYVVERLIDNIIKIDYPKDKFEVHVLDDSNDETIELANNKVEFFRNQGYNIKHITRNNRNGFKAGALKEAMQYVKGEFIAIFDADFLPDPQFLKNCLPYFKDERVGVVQTRWSHINQEHSIITELQAFQLNVHFTVEQLGRSAANLMLQFNGTAGIWRKETIEDAGGWEADTLTEDLDLSYRAQLKGWQIAYLEDIVSPAELPSEMNSLKSQQFRWMKGGAETAKKLLPSVWKSDLRPIQKIHASIHLLSSTIFLCIFIIGVFSVPLIFFINPLGIDDRYFMVFLSGLLSIMAVYYVANVETAWKGNSKFKNLYKFVVLFPVFLALSMGLSLHNSIAVIQGYLGKSTSFVRTPKLNIKSIQDKINKSTYLHQKMNLTIFFEGILALYFIIGLIVGIIFADTTFTFLHILLAVGYSTIFYYSVRHLRYR